MDAQSTNPPSVSVRYDEHEDTLAFVLTEAPQCAVAEEAGDEVWVRYDPDTKRLVTIEVLNLSARIGAAFGPTLIYQGRTDPQRLESLHGLSLSGAHAK